MSGTKQDAGSDVVEITEEGQRVLADQNIDTSSAWSRITTTIDVLDFRKPSRNCGGVITAEVAYVKAPAHVADQPGRVEVAFTFAGVEQGDCWQDGSVHLRCNQIADVALLASAFTALYGRMIADKVPEHIASREAP